MRDNPSSLPARTLFALIPGNKYKKALTPAGARDKRISRYHPDLSLPHDTDLDKCNAALFNAMLLALSPVTGRPGPVYSPYGVLTCNSEVIFNAGAALASHPRQLSVAVHDAYSSSSTSFSLNTRSLSHASTKHTCSGFAHEYAGNKKPLHLRGYSIVAFSPHLAECFRRNWHPSLQLRRAGCRASQGRIPPPLLMRSVCATYSLVYVLTTV